MPTLKYKQSINMLQNLEICLFVCLFVFLLYIIVQMVI